MPVHRIPGPRGRVLATVEELDAWKRPAASDSAAPIAVEAVEPPTRMRRSIAVGIAACLLPLLLVAVAVARYEFAPGVPAGYRIDRYALIVLDHRGHELWRTVFSEQLRMVAYQPGDPPSVWIGDLDGDGRREVLFVKRPESLNNSTPLICYSDRGVERWRFTPGHQVRTSKEEFFSAYWIARFLVGPLGRNRPSSVVVVSNNNLFYPSQVALLSDKGVPLREYWHSGQLTHAQAADLDGDGVDEIYFAGISNAWKAATLVVLDPDRFGGTSQEPEAPDYQLLGFAPGVERARVILPRSCLNRSLEPYNTIGSLKLFPDKIVVETKELRNLLPDASLSYDFAPDLRKYSLTVSDSYRIDFRRVATQVPGCRAGDISGMRILRGGVDTHSTSAATP